MKNLTIIAFLLLGSSCMAQLGFVGGYKTLNPSGWNESFQADLNEEPYPMSGWHIGVDYWFRLKKRRIEFMPETSFAKFEEQFGTRSQAHTQVGFHFYTAFYLFDMASDCNCPTFSKDGNLFGKGFFLEVSPGLVYLKNSLEDESPLLEKFEGEEFAFGGSIGAGLDIGVSKLITLTPLARYNFYLNTDWDYDLQPASFSSTDLKQLFFGIRLRLHFKEFAKARYR